MKIWIVFFILEIYLNFIQSKSDTEHIAKCTDLSYLPMPSNIQCDIDQTKQITINPCLIVYRINKQTQAGQQSSQNKQNIVKILRYQIYRSFKCHKNNQIKFISSQDRVQNSNYYVDIDLKNFSLIYSQISSRQESYSLTIDDKKAQIKCDTYVGFLRALQTFIQSWDCIYRFNIHKEVNQTNNSCHLKYFPISIKDQPKYPYRSIMIDTSRHFIPLQQLKKTLDALMYNKMNILHWHLSDDDSFSICFQGKFKQLCQYAAFSQEQTYTQKQVRELVQYAALRGVVIVPQLDSPGHVGCWQLVPQFKDIMCTQQNSYYQGVLDISLEKTYKIMEEILKKLLSIFPSKKIHLGGDEVKLNFNCMKNVSNFIEYQKIKNDSKQMEAVYRKKQRQILNSIDSSRQAIYWMKQNEDFINPIKESDIIQWWGKISSFYPQFPMKNRIIISHRNDFYIDTGSGNKRGVQYSYGHYFTWYDLFKSAGKMKKWQLNLDDYRRNPQDYILGIQPTLWGQMSNRYTHHQKMWIRCSSLAEQLWRQQQMNAKPNFLQRMTRFQRLLNFRGIPTAPGTCEQCQTHAQFC